MTVARCLYDPACGWSRPASDRRAALAALDSHVDGVHLGRVDVVRQLPSVTFHEAYCAAVAALPAGTEFTTADLHGVVPDPVDHHMWGPAQTAAAHLGLCRAADVQRSTLPSTKGSRLLRWVRVDAKESAA